MRAVRDDTMAGWLVGLCGKFVWLRARRSSRADATLSVVRMQPARPKLGTPLPRLMSGATPACLPASQPARKVTVGLIA